MKRAISFLAAFVLCLGLMTPVSAEEFSDVPAGYIFYDAILDCAGKGIVGGYSDNTFRPAESVTRAQFCVMLVRAFYPGQEKNYAGLKAAGWYLPSAAVLDAKGVMFYGEKYWKDPSRMNVRITRMDMAQFIANVMSEKGYTVSDSARTAALSRFTDAASIDSYYRNAVGTVTALGIITGYADGSFKPHNVMTRGQGAVVLCRMAQCMSGGAGNAVPVPEQKAPTTLANGKPVTEENVLEIINGLRKTWPEGSDFSVGYPVGDSSPVRNVTHPYPREENPETHTSNTLGCGGWATLVSDTVFTQNGFPARKVPLAEARPGDIVIMLNADHQLVHVVSLLSRPQTDQSSKVSFTVSQAATRGEEIYQIRWDSDYTYTPGGTYYYDAYTRYPA